MEVLKALYAENKEFLLPIGTIFISILLLIFFIFPQINGFFQKQNQAAVERGKLNNLEESLSTLSSIDDSSLDRNLEIVSKALPPNKDFAAILNAISQAAQVTGASLGDFEFQIGDITKTNTIPTGTPSIKISLNISADASVTIAFLKELEKNVPISQVAGAKSSGSFAAIEILFYYKPFPPQGTTDPEKIRPVTSENQKIIDELEIPLSLDLNTVGVPEVTATNPL
jgi:hypothetical protein